MSAGNGTVLNLPSAPESVASDRSPGQQVERIRAQLAAAWERGERARIEDFESDPPNGGLDPLDLWRLVREEIRHRHAIGEKPTQDEYHRRFGRYLAEWPTLWFPTRPPSSAGRRGPWAGDRFLDFELVAELGRGSVGQVFLARQHALADRPVVLKFAAEAGRESHVLARLQHTNIVPILSYHRDGDLNAVCMPYFGPTTLASILKGLRSAETVPHTGGALLSTLMNTERRPRRADESWKPASTKTSRTGTRPPSEANKAPEPAAPAPETSIPPALRQRFEKWSYDQAVAWIGARLADGLAHAHERGLLHLDLKPGNTLISDDGQPMLLDFGLAVDLRAMADGFEVLAGGTLPYMAPEQLPLLLKEYPALDERTDLFALGVMLFELLTFRLPFADPLNASREEILRIIDERKGGAPNVRSLNPEVSPAVAAVVANLLEPDPAKRYASARQVSEDLDRHLDDLPLRYTADPSLRERFTKWRRRHPALASWTAASILLIAATTFGLMGMSALETRNARLATVNSLAELRRATRDEYADLERRSASTEELERRQVAWRERLAAFGLSEAGDDAEPLLGRIGAAAAEGRANLAEALQLLADFHWRRSLKATDPAERRAWIEKALFENQRTTALRPEGQAATSGLFQRARLLNALGRKDEADRLFAKLDVDGPPEARGDFETAVALHRGRQWAAAEGKLKSLLDAHPHWSDVWQLLGRCQQERGQDAESIVSLTVAIAERPTAYERYLDRGLAYARLGRLQEALKDFERSVQLNPGFAHGFGNRGIVRMKLGDAAGAIDDFTRAIELWPRQPKFWFLRADAKRLTGDQAGADADQTAGAAVVPDDAEGWVALALRRIDDDPAAALRDLDEALKLDPHSREALQNKAAAFDRLRRPADSLAALDKLLASNPDYALGLAGRCVLLARKRDEQAARRDAERALAVDPSPAIQYQVAGCYALLGRSRRDDADTAFRLLAAALRGGFGQQFLADDPDLDPIRNDPRFAELQAAVRQFARLEGSSAKP